MIVVVVDEAGVIAYACAQYAHVSSNASSAARIVFVRTAEFASMTEPKLQLVDSTYPTKPDAELRF